MNRHFSRSRFFADFGPPVDAWSAECVPRNLAFWGQFKFSGFGGKCWKSLSPKRTWVLENPRPQKEMGVGKP